MLFWQKFNLMTFKLLKLKKLLKKFKNIEQLEFEKQILLKILLSPGAFDEASQMNYWK